MSTPEEEQVDHQDRADDDDVEVLINIDPVETFWCGISPLCRALVSWRVR
jgi:hypothetical protein